MPTNQLDLTDEFTGGRVNTKDLAVIFDRMDKFTSGLVKKIALDVHANLVAAPGEGGTPVDTGWARSNWIPRVGSAYQDVAGTRPVSRNDINAVAIGLKQSVFGAIDEGPQIEGVASLAGYRISLGDIHVTNNVPYIQALNAGSSQQAPAGFIERAIVKAVTEDIRR